MEYLLEMVDVSKQFLGVKVLDKVNLRLRKGTIHALVGENGAGKSTLIKCLSGMYLMDEGRIFFEGEEQSFSNIAESIKKGIVVINQELSPVLERSVMENIWLGREPLKNGFVDNKKMLNQTNDLMRRMNIGNINPKDKLKQYSIANHQIIEILRALSYNAKVIVMDEPTSSLTSSEVGKLFEIIKQLKKNGVSIIYISHKMSEIKSIADEITVLRDGKHVSTDYANEVQISEIINRMVGRKLTYMFPKREKKIGKVILKVENLTSEGVFKNISFELMQGEVLGFAGLVGAGRTEVAEALFGIRRKTGSIFINGKSVDINSPNEALKNGVIMLTEDRRATGIVPVLSVGTNIILANYDAYFTTAGILNNKKMKLDINEYIKKLNVKTFSSEIQIQKLSGGNQQKAIIARWLLVKPDILIMDEPTRGIDVGAKAEIYALISELAAAGKAIIMISSELPEILGMSDRIIVMHAGEIKGVLDVKDADQEKIMKLAMKSTSTKERGRCLKQIR